MPHLRPMEIALIVLVIVLLFGARKLPELARSVGTSLKILRSEVKDLHDDGHGDGGRTEERATVSDRPARSPAPAVHAVPAGAPTQAATDHASG